jgi:hypothetical protein
MNDSTGGSVSILADLLFATNVIEARADEFIVGGALCDTAFLRGEFEGLFAIELGLVHEFLDACCERLRGVGVGACLGRIGGADQQSDFATGWAFFEGRGDFRKFSAEKLLMKFGDFAREACGTVTENFAGVGDCFSDAVGRFVEDEGAVLDAEAFEGAAALAAARREKSDEEEFLVG